MQNLVGHPRETGVWRFVSAFTRVAQAGTWEQMSARARMLDEVDVFLTNPANRKSLSTDAHGGWCMVYVHRDSPEVLTS